MTNGAKALIDTLINAGVDTCFTNPGTSEMHFVAALDCTDMKAILNVELERVGAEGAGTKAKSQLDLSEPPIDFVALAQGMGMSATTISTAGGFNE
jgi:thiamine pyrophosphate-dependent acetolactate synthase large subunit-like protein